MSSILNDDVQDVQHGYVKPRQPTSALPFFTFIREKKEGIKHNSSLAQSGISVCNSIGCGFSIEGKNTAILINHLKLHKKEYATIMSKFKEKGIKDEPLLSNQIVNELPNDNTVKTTMEVQPKNIVTSPVAQVTKAIPLSSPNLTENSVAELSAQQESLEGLPQTQCQWKLPLNSPLLVPVLLPSGTTLIVLDSSTLKIVHANTSQNFPVKINVTSSPMPPDATSTSPKYSQPTANPSSSVGGISSAISELSANNSNQTRSSPGSIDLAKPYNRSTRIAPIEHIRLQALPSPIALSPSTETENIDENISATESIPVIQLTSQSRSTIPYTETLQTGFTKNKPSDVHKQLDAATLISHSVLEQTLQKDILATESETREQLKPNSYGDGASRANSFDKSLPVATGTITIASFAKLDEPMVTINSNISKMVMPVECIKTDLAPIPPFNSIVSANEPLEAGTASYSENPNSEKSAALNTTIQDAGSSSITELNAPHNGSESNDKSLGETEKIRCEGSHPIFQFFHFNDVTGRSECIVDNCGVSRNGKNPANLINHLRQKHPKKEYAEFMAKWTTRWARPKRKAAIINTTNTLLPSKILRSTRTKKAKKNLRSLNEKGIESVPAPKQTGKEFPAIVTPLVSTGSLAPRSSSDGGPTCGKKLSVGSNIRQAVLKNSRNLTVLGHRKDFFNEKMHPVYRYFTFHEATDRTEWPAEDGECGKSVCNFQGCDATIKGNKPASLMVHLKLKHGNAKEYAEFLALNEEFAQFHHSITKSSEPNKPGKRSRAQIEDEKACKDYFELRKKQREHLGVGKTLSPSLVKGMTIFPVRSLSSPSIASKTNAVPSSSLNHDLDFIGPDTPPEYASSLKTTVRHEQPLLTSMFPQRQSQQFIVFKSENGSSAIN